MLPFVRASVSAPRPSFRPLALRSFAQIVPAPPSNSPTPTTALGASLNRSRNILNKGRIPVREDHGLYAFFRRKEPTTGGDLVGDAKYEVVETPEKAQNVTGRSWRASELRLKSFTDLHTLWYVLLRERNLLATQKEEARRMGVQNPSSQVSAVRVHQCRKSMGCIKAVLNERRLAYEGAVKVVEDARDNEESVKVQRYLETTQRKQRRHLKRRRVYEARHMLQKPSDGAGPAETPAMAGIPDAEPIPQPIAEEQHTLDTVKQ